MVNMHIRGRLSNLFERISLALYHFFSDHMLWIIIEPDTTDPSADDVSNAAITLSNKLANEIFSCGINAEGGNANIMFGCIKEMEWIYSLEWNNSAGSVPLQYCPQFHTWGCQPWFPSPTQLLNMMGLPTDKSVVIPVRRLFKYQDGHYLYGFHAPDTYSCWFIPLEWIIYRMAFRYIDNRYK